jgi:serine/threonine protein kinase
MSPESIQAPMSVDARSDIYAVGAVGYFLLTGEPVFDAENLVVLCQKHVDEKPMPPSERIGRSVSPELEFTILACLEKDRAKRPQNARDLSRMISRAPSASLWTVDAYEDWWRRHALGHPAESSEADKRVPVDNRQPGTTLPSECDRTIVANIDSEDDEQFDKQV